MKDLYATPKAELGNEESTPAGLQGTGRAPTTFGDTLAEMFRLLPKVIIALSGYALLWSILYFAALFVMFTGAGVSAVLAGPLMVVVFIVGGLFVMAMGAYFWTVAFRRLDNVYRFDTKGGEFGFAVGKLLPVLAAFILKGLVVVPFVGVAWMIMWSVIETSTGGFGSFMGIMGLVFLLQMAGWVVYMFVHFGDMAVICEDTGPVDGIRRSFELMRGFRNWFYAVGLFFVVTIIVWVGMMALYCMVAIPLGLLTGAGMELVGPEAGIFMTIVSNLISLALGVISLPVFAVANYMIFQSLRARWQIGREPTW